MWLDKTSLPLRLTGMSYRRFQLGCLLGVLALPACAGSDNSTDTNPVLPDAAGGGGGLDAGGAGPQAEGGSADGGGSGLGSDGGSTLDGSKGPSSDGGTSPGPDATMSDAGSDGGDADTGPGSDAGSGFPGEGTAWVTPAPRAT